MSMIETTYVMRLDVLNQLRDAKKETKIPKEFLLVLCMQQMLADYKRYLRDTQRIEYQKRFDEVTHMPIPKTRVKVRIFGKEYNFFQDMRKFFSRSISLCIGIAVFEYLEQVIMSLKENGGKVEADNYPFNFYAIFEKCIENVTTFRIWWGLPANVALIFDH